MTGEAPLPGAATEALDKSIPGFVSEAWGKRI